MSTAQRRSSMHQQAPAMSPNQYILSQMIKTFKSPQDTGTVSPNEDLTHVNPKSISVAARYKSARRRNKSATLQAASPHQVNGSRQVLGPPGGPPARQGHIRSLLTTPLSSAIPSAIHTAVSNNMSELASPLAVAAVGGANGYSDQAARDQKLMQIAQSSRNKTLLHLAHERQHQAHSKQRRLGASQNHTAKKSTKYSEHVRSLNKFSSR